MIRFRLWSVLLLLFLEACTVGPSGTQGDTSASKRNRAERMQNSEQHSATNDIRARESPKKEPCSNLRRPLNPDSNPQPSETALERYFRLAYNAETEGNFNAAIMNYRRAAELATCECDRLHARAGEQAAKEASKLLSTEGAASKPTQFFWGRLQELTQSLSCVTKENL